MKNLAAILTVVLLLSSCEKKQATIPEGFEHISKDGRAHFIYVNYELLGDKVDQREAGRLICKEVFNEADYCEIYYFSRKEEVPLKFPIMNRIRPIGYYEIKNNKEKFKVLTDNDIVTYQR